MAIIWLKGGSPQNSNSTQARERGEVSQPYCGDGLAPCGCLQIQDMNVVVPASPRAVPLQERLQLLLYESLVVKHYKKTILIIR